MKTYGDLLEGIEAGKWTGHMWGSPEGEELTRLDHDDAVEEVVVRDLVDNPEWPTGVPRATQDAPRSTRWDRYLDPETVEIAVFKRVNPELLVGPCEEVERFEINVKAWRERTGS